MSDNTNDNQTRVEDLVYIRRMEAERDAAIAALAVQSRQREAAEAMLVELKPDPVLVEGSWFEQADLPEVLGNFMRSANRYASDAKEMTVRAMAAESALSTARADALIDAALIAEAIARQSLMCKGVADEIAAAIRAAAITEGGKNDE